MTRTLEGHVVAGLVITTPSFVEGTQAFSPSGCVAAFSLRAKLHNVDRPKSGAMLCMTRYYPKQMRTMSQAEAPSEHVQCLLVQQHCVF